MSRVGEPDVLGEEGAVEVGADDVLAVDSLGAVLAVVAVA
jgi:hypothetical protein